MWITHHVNGRHKNVTGVLDAYAEVRVHLIRKEPYLVCARKQEKVQVFSLTISHKPNEFHKKKQAVCKTCDCCGVLHACTSNFEKKKKETKNTEQSHWSYSVDHQNCVGSVQGSGVGVEHLLVWRWTFSCRIRVFGRICLNAKHKSLLLNTRPSKCVLECGWCDDKKIVTSFEHGSLHIRLHFVANMGTLSPKKSPCPTTQRTRLSCTQDSVARSTLQVSARLW